MRDEYAGMRWLGSTPRTYSSVSHSPDFTVIFDRTAVKNDLYGRFRPTSDQRVLILTSVSSEYPKINFTRSALPFKVYCVMILDII